MKPVVVIGAGFGGLAAAIRLRAQGHEVILLEANEQAGGRASVFRQDGFTFDGGPTIITAPYLFEEIFRLAGKDPKDYYELMPIDPFFRVVFPDGTVYNYNGDVDNILAQIKAISPGDVDGYLRMAKQAEAIFKVGYEQLVDVSFDNPMDMLKVVPDMIRLGSYRSVYGMVSSFIKDERLRQLFTFQPLLIGGNPYNCTSIYLLIHWIERKWGVWFPKGGMGALVEAMVRLFADIGGDLRLNAPVAEIEVENGVASAVRLEDGTRIEAASVVCNADPSFVYTKMIDKKHRRKHTDASIARKVPSMSLFVSYFGTKTTYPELAHHTILLGPRYKGLLDDIFTHHTLADDFSLYLHAPTRSDASLAPPGHEGFYVLSPVPNQRSKLDWAEQVDRYEQRVFDFLDAGVVPGLKANMVTKKTVDPRYFEGRLRSIDGAAFGIEPRLTQSAYFRFHNRSEDVRELYFVGAGTHPGAGVPGVLNSAKVLERVVTPPAARKSA